MARKALWWIGLGDVPGIYDRYFGARVTNFWLAVIGWCGVVTAVSLAFRGAGSVAACMLGTC